MNNFKPRYIEGETVMYPPDPIMEDFYVTRIEHTWRTQYDDLISSWIVTLKTIHIPFEYRCKHCGNPLAIEKDTLVAVYFHGGKTLGPRRVYCKSCYEEHVKAAIDLGINIP